MAAETIVRRLHDGAPPVGRHVESMMIDISTHTTIVTADVGLNGRIDHALVVAPALDGTQFTFSILDEDADEMYTSGLKADGSDHPLSPDISVAGKITLKIVAATTQLADRTFNVKLIYR